MKAKFIIDKDWLINQYEVLLKSASEIAKIVGCSITPVLYNLKKYDIKIRHSNKSQKLRPSASDYPILYDKDWLIGEYIIKLKTAADIARDLGCNTTVVRYHLIINEIPIRPRCETVRLPQVIEQNRKQNLGDLNGMYGKNHTDDARNLMKKARHDNPIKMSIEEKKKRSDRWKGTNNPMYDIHRFGELNPSWQGGISFGKYCKLFNNEFKEYVRNKFNRSCYLYGDIESNRKHHVHHIDYNKNSICNGKEWAFVPLCQHCHLKTNQHKWHWFNLLINYWAMVYWNENIIYYT